MAEPQPTGTTTPRPRRRRWIVAVPVAVALVVAGLVVFAPWKLVVDEVVDEALPTSTASARAPSATSSTASSTGSPAAVAAKPSAAAAGPTVLSAGELISHEHATRGSVRLLALPDGTRVLRLQGLDTSNGPDLHVWLSDQPVVDGPSGWTVFDDGRYVDLGGLKGNKGSQNYAVPAGTDLDGLRSVSIWCARFRVSFGAATLAAT